MLGGGGDEVSVMPVFYPRGTVSVLSLNYFLSVGSSSKPSHPYLTLSLGVHLIQEYFKKNGGGGNNTSSHRKRRPGMRSRGIK